MCTDENEKLNKTKATGKMEIFHIHFFLPHISRFICVIDQTELVALYRKKNHDQTTKLPLFVLPLIK